MHRETLPVLIFGQSGEVNKSEFREFNEFESIHKEPEENRICRDVGLHGEMQASVSRR